MSIESALGIPDHPKCPQCLHYNKTILEAPCVECFGTNSRFEEDYGRDNVVKGDYVKILGTIIWENRVRPGEIYQIDEVVDESFILIRHPEGYERTKKYRRMNIALSTKFIRLPGYKPEEGGGKNA